MYHKMWWKSITEYLPHKSSEKLKRVDQIKMWSYSGNPSKVPPFLVDKALTILGVKWDNKCKLKRLRPLKLYIAPGYDS